MAALGHLLSKGTFLAAALQDLIKCWEKEERKERKKKKEEAICP